MFQTDAPQDTDPSTPDTSLVVGLIFAATLLSVVAFLVFKRVSCLYCYGIGFQVTLMLM